ncbi:MAG: hypothetical protein WA980_20605 [Shinella zoogloeoides]|uniref:hypothetical protein n=1 Tax=Shinella zoogloeoides TaxID=352475 RepID=UPI003C714867
MITDERKFEFEQAIRRAVPRELFVEVKERFPLAAEQADAAVRNSHTAVTNGVPLSRGRQSKATGLVRHQLIDQVFEEILARHGGTAVTSVPVETAPDEIKAAPIHLTTGSFDDTLVGFASHRELLDAPSKNATRRALCHQNRGLSEDLFHSLELFKDRQRFVLIMVRRDPAVLGKIASITVCIADSRAEVFLYQSDIDDFLAGYGAAATIEKKEAPKFRDVSGTFKEARRGGDRTDRAKEE